VYFYASTLYTSDRCYGLALCFTWTSDCLNTEHNLSKIVDNIPTTRKVIVEGEGVVKTEIDLDIESKYLKYRTLTDQNAPTPARKSFSRNRRIDPQLKIFA
jgi:hypothetical protein